MEITVQGAADLARKLNVNIRRELQPAMVAIGAVLQGIIAPYPAAPSYTGRKRWYERGYGQRWLRKDGTKGGIKTSQFLNRSWAVEPDTVTNGALVTNKATYSPWLHLQQKQTKVAERIGWITDRDGIRRAEQSGDIVRVVEKALSNILPTEGR
jgi:hypothetical protein